MIELNQTSNEKLSVRYVTLHGLESLSQYCIHIYHIREVTPLLLLRAATAGCLMGLADGGCFHQAAAAAVT